MLYTQNRELSWLGFNRRVLSEAADTAVPLLERLKFISIFNSNLDEFFMTRIGSLKKSEGMTPCIDRPSQLLSRIHGTVVSMYADCADIYGAVIGELALRGVEIVRADSLCEADKKYVKRYFKDRLMPTLSPQIIDSHHPFPKQLGRAVYCAAIVRRRDRERLALIPVPTAPPLIVLPGESLRVVLAEEAVAAHLDTVFSELQRVEQSLIAVTRDADIGIENGVSYNYFDFRDRMSTALKKRRTAAPVRLETEDDISNRLKGYLCSYLHLTGDHVYRRTYPMDMSFAYLIGKMLDSSATAKMSYPPLPHRPRFGGCATELVMRQDVLLSYPFDDTEIFLTLLRECADDPEVLSIKITVYRLGVRSRLVEYLCRAAENGKDVTVLIELRARFDEERNIRWSRHLEESGCRIIYGIEDCKVHSKICLITRRTDGELRYITQIGTGNYNERTSRLYTDLCLITSAKDIGEDADSFFRNMAMGNAQGRYTALLSSPFSLKERVISLIAKETAKGKDGRIIMKLNSLDDAQVIKALRDASCAGVKTELIVRGICCILPRVPGETENITVRSIVGRFLEHSRIYVFGDGDEAAVYISSADMMRRNTEKRVELACPVRCGKARDKIMEILSLCLRDSVKARLLTAGGEYLPICSEEEIDCQEALMYGETHDGKPL